MLLGVSPDQLSDTELHAAVVEIHRQCTQLEAEKTRLIAAWEARKVWAGNGSKSPACRLSADCKISMTTARRQVRRARRLRTMPLTTAAFADGSLSVDHVDRLVAVNTPDVNHLFERDEQVLVEQARELWPWVFDKTVAYWKQCANDEIGKEDPAAKLHAERHFSATVGFNGCTNILGRLDPVSGAVFRTELERLEQILFEADWAAARAQHGPDALPEHLPRTATQRLADAVELMARRSAAMDPDATPTRPLVTVLVDYPTLAGRICELADGTVISPGSVVPYLTEADIERVVFQGPSRVIDVGVSQRLFRGATRRAIDVRDRYCTHPSGCDTPSDKCQGDHIEPYAVGGPTTQANGRPFCRFHNNQRNQRPPPDGL